MKRLLILAFIPCVAFAQQPTPEQQRFGDIAGAIAEQREVALNQVAQQKATILQLQRELAESKKKAEACEPKKEEKK